MAANTAVKDNKTVKKQPQEKKPNKFVKGTKETVSELKKVTWPTKAEVRVTTLAVLILVVVMSIFLGIVDFGLVNLVKLITSLGT